jgi:hypothetical protein
VIPGAKERRGGRTSGTWPKGANGPGWGGEAKGAGNANSRATVLAGAADHGAGPGRGHKSLATVLAEVDDAELVGVWLDVARNAIEHPGARVVAVEKIVERKHGKVPNVNENMNTNRSAYDAAYAVLRNASPATRASLRAVLQQAQLEAQAVEIEGDAE